MFRASKIEPIWTESLLTLTRAISRRPPRRPVHEELLGKSGRRVVLGLIVTTCAQEMAEAASDQWRCVANQIRPKVPKLAAIMDEAEHEVLAYNDLPEGTSGQAALDTQLIQSSGIYGEMMRRTDVGIFPQMKNYIVGREQ
ncbi:hypothetical protein EH240_36775 [Mesorhizobium tamadayense]|uniref:Uncharacterized protein n=1 Tax=Mesorhizobium tamadayense TaxID=425306 RepID=A0A3P3ELJ0_9HYPH|nr:hypothetical protein EH240_36775 [Mesorhizobium tamadayense]